jgi:hypothetical protein
MTARYQGDGDYTWQPYRLRPLAVWAMRMNTGFRITTLQGSLEGKAGDWLVRADDGVEYPVPDEVFRRYYVKREWRKPNESTSTQSTAEKHEQKASQGRETSPQKVG